MSKEAYDGNVFVNQKNLFAILRSKKINGHAFRVIFLMLGMVDYKNIIQFDVDDFAEMLDSTKEEVIKSIKYLIKKRIIELDENNNYQFNLKFAWRGSYKDYQEAVKVKARKDKMTKLDLSVVKD